MGIISLADRLTKWVENGINWASKRKKIANANKTDKSVDAGDDKSIADKLSSIVKKRQDRTDQ